MNRNAEKPVKEKLFNCVVFFFFPKVFEAVQTHPNHFGLFPKTPDSSAAVKIAVRLQGIEGWGSGKSLHF